MTVQTEPAAARTGFAATGFGPVAKRRLEIRQVWAHNVEQEFALIRHAAERFPYVSMDTEFPGVIHRPNPRNAHHAALTPSENYAAVRANVDALHLIQVGLAFAASPDAPAPCLAFQINLREFDPRVHRHAPDSVALLRDHGLDFAAHRAHGVDARVFAALLMSSGLVCCCPGVTWVTFSGGYDFGYLVKLLMGRKLPKTLPEFLGLVRVFFGDAVYDVKHVIRSCPGVPGGLDKAAAALGVARESGMAHQAGSDAALTWAVFRRVREVYFAKGGVRGFAGVVHSLELHLDLNYGSGNKCGGGGGNRNRNRSGNRNGRKQVSPVAVAALR